MSYERNKKEEEIEIKNLISKKKKLRERHKLCIIYMAHSSYNILIENFPFKKHCIVYSWKEKLIRNKLHYLKLNSTGTINTWNWEFEVINNNKWWVIVNLTLHTTKFIPINDYLNIRLVVELEINNTCIIHQS